MGTSTSRAPKPRSTDTSNGENELSADFWKTTEPPHTIAAVVSRVHDLAVAYVGQSLLPCTLFRANTIARDGKHSIFKTSGDHGIRAVREHQIRGMGDNIRTFERQGAGRFGIEPVEADHEPDPRWTNIIDGKSRVPRRKP